jgi:Spy/CpxP family protein refolding chaperone
MRLQRMSQHLNLTDDQKARLTPIVQNEAEQARAIRQDTSLTPEQRRAKMKELRQSTRTQIEPILTAEQKEKMDTFARRGKAMRGSKGMGTDTGRHMDRLSQKLNLTDEQKSKLQPLFEEHRKQMQSLRQDTSLTPEQKRAKLKELRQANHQQMMSVLTPEQQQKLEQMRASQPHNRRGYGTGMGPDMQPAQSSPPQM